MEWNTSTKPARILFTLQVTAYAAELPSYLPKTKEDGGYQAQLKRLCRISVFKRRRLCWASVVRNFFFLFLFRHWVEHGATPEHGHEEDQTSLWLVEGIFGGDDRHSALARLDLEKGYF